MLIISFRVFMRLKLSENMHVKCIVEYLAFIKCSINASGSNLNIQVPICLKRLCLWTSAHVISLLNVFWGMRENDSFLCWLLPKDTCYKVTKNLNK